MNDAQNPYLSTEISSSKPQKIRVHQLQRWKEQNHKWAMLTCYDFMTAQIFDEADIPVLLVGDSAANVVYGYETTLSITTDELLNLVKAVSRGAKRAMIVCDLVFGSYEATPQQALDTAIRFVKEGNAHAVKIEGGAKFVDHIGLLTKSGIPVMAHLGFTPQSVHQLSGYKVQGVDPVQAQKIRDTAWKLYEAGAFSIVLEMVPASLAERIAEELPIPIIGIGAGNKVDAQVLVWQDAAGLGGGNPPKFVRQYTNLHKQLTQLAQDYQKDIAQGLFPSTHEQY